VHRLRDRSHRAGRSIPTCGHIHDTAELVSAAGGKGIAAAVDDADDEQVRGLFERVAHEQGRIDILVNNATIIRDVMMGPTIFWEEPLNVIDTLNVGLRSSYVATVFACVAVFAVPHQ
jgi:NAD(P)-dependent dehydrogenase (short-subunit alcohol dehydrogenase family)